MQRIKDWYDGNGNIAEPGACRDLYMHEWFALMPIEGGMDAQPAKRIYHMNWARRVLALRRKQNASQNYAQDMNKFDTQLEELLQNLDMKESEFIEWLSNRNG